MTRTARDLTGRRFGRLTVTSIATISGNGARWHTQCDCGGTKIILANSLLYGLTRSCGCLAKEIKRRPAIDLTGQRFTRLVVIAPAESIDRRTRWRVRCDCGTEKVVNTKSLKRGESRSCGCLGRDMARERARKVREAREAGLPPSMPPPINYKPFSSPGAVAAAVALGKCWGTM
jgi:hypothetical protein